MFDFDVVTGPSSIVHPEKPAETPRPPKLTAGHEGPERGREAEAKPAKGE